MGSLAKFNKGQNAPSRSENTDLRSSIVIHLMYCVLSALSNSVIDSWRTIRNKRKLVSNNIGLTGGYCMWILLEILDLS